MFISLKFFPEPFFTLSAQFNDMGINTKSKKRTPLSATVQMDITVKRKLQLVIKKKTNIIQLCFKFLSVPGKKDKIIHVAQIISHSQTFLYSVIKEAKIIIGQILRDKITDGYPFAEGGMVSGNDFSKKRKQVSVFESPVQKVQQYFLIHGIKISADIKFQIPSVFA